MGGGGDRATPQTTPPGPKKVIQPSAGSPCTDPRAFEIPTGTGEGAGAETRFHLDLYPKRGCSCGLVGKRPQVSGNVGVRPDGGERRGA